MKENQNKLIISEEVLHAIVNNLSEQPYKYVVQLMSAIEKDVVPFVKTEEDQ